MAGRVKHQKPDLPEEEIEAAVAALEEKDPAVERFRDIGEHKGFSEE